MSQRHRGPAPVVPIVAHDGPTMGTLAHLETLELPPEVAGNPSIRRRAPAHRRLARRNLIPPEVETEIELFALAWEMVEGGAHEPGSGGDGVTTRDEVYTRALLRLDRMRARVGEWWTRLVVAACVECQPAAALAVRYLAFPVPDPPPARLNEEAREALDYGLVPILWQMAGLTPA